jgi:hypothetical protein
LTHEVPVPSSVETAGVPQAMASSIEMPNASARLADGSTNTSAAW